MEPPPSLSTIFQDLWGLIKKFLGFDAVSAFFHMISDHIKKFMASASDAVLYVVDWFKNGYHIAIVAVAVIGLLMICCCWTCVVQSIYCCGKYIVKSICCCCKYIWSFCKSICCCCWNNAGKTMKAPGQPFRILRAPFEANPAAYFRSLRGR